MEGQQHSDPQIQQMIQQLLKAQYISEVYKSELYKRLLRTEAVLK